MQSGSRARAIRSALRLEHAASIEELPAAEWDACLGDRGAFAVAGLRFLERLFGPHQPPENHWVFHYYRVADERDRPVLLTFFTEALWKDDMLAPAEVSAAVEERRRADPYHATSKMFAMGSLLTEGNHLFLAREGPWRDALQLLLEDVHRRAREGGASGLILRDLPASDEELIALLGEMGLDAIPEPPSWVLNQHRSWSTEEEFLAGLKPKWRTKIRSKIFRWNRHYSTRILTADSQPRPSPEELEHLHRLYRAVKLRSLALNTFDLPVETFQEALAHPGWELLVMELRPDLDSPHTVAAAVQLAFAGREHYVPVVIGVDYQYVASHAAYRQTIWRVIARARELGLQRVLFGFEALHREAALRLCVCRASSLTQFA